MKVGRIKQNLLNLGMWKRYSSINVIDIYKNMEYSQYFIITINGVYITFKNCESLYCTPITYTSIKK